MTIVVLASITSAAAAAQASLPGILVSTPGPGSSVALPLELALKIGADRDTGVALHLKFVGRGDIALQDIDSGDADSGCWG